MLIVCVTYYSLIEEKICHHPDYIEYRRFLEDIRDHCSDYLAGIKEEILDDRLRFQIAQLQTKKNREKYLEDHRRLKEEKQKEYKTETDVKMGRVSPVDGINGLSLHRDRQGECKHRGEERGAGQLPLGHGERYSYNSELSYANQHLYPVGMESKSMYTGNKTNEVESPLYPTIAEERDAPQTNDTNDQISSYSYVKYPEIGNHKTNGAIDTSDPLLAPTVGIRNPGSMCYVSAPLAVIIRLEIFQEFVQQHGKSNPPHESVQFLIEKLRWDMGCAEANHTRSIDLPYGFDRILMSHGLNVVIGESGDAQEALSCMLEGLSMEFGEKKTPFDMKLQTWRTFSSGTMKPIPSVVDRCMHVTIPKNAPLKSGRFEQRQNSLLRMLSRGSSDPVGLESCLEQYLEPSEPDGQEGDSFVSYLEEPPLILMIHLRRSEREMNLASGSIDSGADVLCPNFLSIRLPESEHGAEYRLRAVISHIRLKDGANEEIGHYVAVVRYPDSGKCIICDDSHVTMLPEYLDAACAPQQVYLAFYELLDTSVKHP